MYRSIVILTGAGISAESGIDTFRGAGGLWENYRAEDLATPEAYARNPLLVQRFYNERRRKILDDTIRPNPAHLALARLEQRFVGQFTLVTQNVDNLHEQAGSRNILHMHGELLRMRCTHCNQCFDMRVDIEPDTACDGCGRAGKLRPDVVWFGETPRHMGQIQQALGDCDLFLSVGTSGTVYPAAGFVDLVSPAAHTVEINLEPSHVGSRFAEHLYGSAGEILPEFVEGLTASLTGAIE